MAQGYLGGGSRYIVWYINQVHRGACRARSRLMYLSAVKFETLQPLLSKGWRVVGHLGLEPRTSGLKVRCSAN